MQYFKLSQILHSGTFKKQIGVELESTADFTDFIVILEGQEEDTHLQISVCPYSS